MVKPTPKPWRVQQDRYGGYRIVTDDGTTIATVMLHTAFPGTGKANAHYLAAAPEAIEALKALGSLPDGYCFCPFGRQTERDQHTGECTDARAAIAKAEGRAEPK